MSAKKLKLEITEGVFAAESKYFQTMLHTFREMGGCISIDDFGTGYSSLSYLERIPVDQVKIDRRFILNIGRDEKGRSLTKAIISMAHELNLDVIAEGVENEEQVAFLRKHKCDSIQGFYFSPAVDEDELKGMLLEQDEVVAQV